MRAWRAALAAFALLCCQPAKAVMVPFPEPVSLPFGPGSAKLHGAVRAAVDRLAVRALRCDGKGGVSVVLRHEREADASLLRQRQAEVEARFRALRIPVSVRLELRAFTEPEADAEVPSQPRNPPWALEAQVLVGDNEFCWDGDVPFAWSAHEALLTLLGEFESGLSLEPPRLPESWSLLTPEVRRDHLGLALARLAYERQLTGSAQARAVYWWLVQNEAMDLPPDRKLLWALHLWAAAGDADLRELQRLLVLPGLPLEARAIRVPELVLGQLPWQLIESRLLAPGLMHAVVENMLSVDGSQPRLLLTEAVVQRGEWRSWKRLLDAAGPARSCLMDDAAFLLWSGSVSPAQFESALASLPQWVAGTAKPYRTASETNCNPTGTLLRIATNCFGEWGTTKPSYAARWLQAGFVLDAGTLTEAQSPNGWTLHGSAACRVEPNPGGEFPYRARTR